MPPGPSTHSCLQCSTTRVAETGNLCLNNCTTPCDDCYQWQKLSLCVAKMNAEYERFIRYMNAHSPGPYDRFEGGSHV